MLQEETDLEMLLTNFQVGVDRYIYAEDGRLLSLHRYHLNVDLLVRVNAQRAKFGEV